MSVTGDGVSSSATPHPSGSDLESQNGAFPELLGPSGEEGASGVEKPTEGESGRLVLVSCCFFCFKKWFGELVYFN